MAKGKEKPLTGEGQSLIWKKLLRYIKKYRLHLLLSLVFAALSSVLVLYVPILTGRAIDCIVTKGQVDFDGVRHILSQLVAVAAVTAAAQWMKIGRAHV